MTTFAAELIFWIVLPGLVAVGAAYLVWLLMQARVQVLTAHYQTAVAKVENDCEGRRPGVEDLLAEQRMERRRFVRRVPGPTGVEITVITQERLYLRNIPITGWMQEELPLSQGEELPPETTDLPLIATAGGRAGPVALPPA